MRHETREIIIGVFTIIIMAMVVLAGILGTIAVFIYSFAWYQIAMAILVDIALVALVVLFLVAKGSKQ